MMYLIILFIPPLYLATRRKWGALTLNIILYLVALATVMLFGIGVFFWALAVGHAGWHYRGELMERQAERIAKKVAGQMRRTP